MGSVTQLSEAQIFRDRLQVEKNNSCSLSAKNLNYEIPKYDTFASSAFTVFKIMQRCTNVLLNTIWKVEILYLIIPISNILITKCL